MIERRYRTAELLWTAGLFGFSILFVAAMIVGKWPNYWVYIASEMTPMTWWESMVLFACCLFALLNAFLIFIQNGYSRRVLIWFLLAAAFFFLTLDERFALHERVRDNWLAPRDVKLLPWVGAGDFLLLLYAIIGLVFLRYLFRELQLRKAAVRWFIAGAAAGAFAVILDSFDVSKMSLAKERLEQTVEEVFELGAMLAFLLAFSLITSTMLQRIIKPHKKE